jgi:hypothetical protein
MRELWYKVMGVRFASLRRVRWRDARVAALEGLVDKQWRELGEAEDLVAEFASDYDNLKGKVRMLEAENSRLRSQNVALNRLLREAELVNEKVRVMCG